VKLNNEMPEKVKEYNRYKSCYSHNDFQKPRNVKPWMLFNKCIALPLSWCSGLIGHMEFSGGFNREAHILGTENGTRSCVPVFVTDSDCAMHDEEGIFAVLNMTTRLITETMPDSALEMSARFAARNEIDQVWCAEIDKLYACMLDQHCPYGVITTYDRTWFCKTAATGVLGFSDAINCDLVTEEGVSLLASLAAFMHHAKHDTNTVDLTTVPNDDTCDAQPCAKKPKLGEITSDKTTVLFDVRDPQMTIKDANLLEQIAYGRSGKVFFGLQPNNVEVVLKMVSVSEIGPSKFLQSEIKMYHHLNSLQGVAIPYLMCDNVFSGITNHTYSGVYKFCGCFTVLLYRWSQAWYYVTSITSNAT
jgi:hypothetical protein